ncbi:MAG: hypothetical protein IKH77_09385 [Clostridia bacterium]|nr:hypothetical protein [Clostridia bacterium]
MAAKRKNRYIFGSDPNPHRVRRFFLRLGAALLILLALAAALNFSVFGGVAMETVWVTVPDLPADIEQFSILHLSDLHGAVLGDHQSAIGRVLSGQRFSCCVITGDMLGPRGETEPLEELLDLLPEGLLTVYVPGDEDPPYLDASAHGSLSPLALWAETLQKRGVRILDTPLLIERGRKGQARLWLIPESLCALDLDSIEHQSRVQLERLSAITALTPDEAAAKRVYQYQLDRVAAIRQAVKDMKDSDIRIVAAHTPITRDHVQTLMDWSGKDDPLSIRRASLVLAGHFCAGQWRIPGLGAIHVPELGWFPEDSLIMGFGWADSVPQYISPGLGASGAYPWQPFRLMNRPVITRIYLSAKTH